MSEPYNSLTTMLDDMTSALEEYVSQHGTTLPQTIQGRLVGILDDMHLLQFLLEHAFDERKHG